MIGSVIMAAMLLALFLIVFSTASKSFHCSTTTSSFRALGITQQLGCGLPGAVRGLGSTENNA